MHSIFSRALKSNHFVWIVCKFGKLGQTCLTRWLKNECFAEVISVRLIRLVDSISVHGVKHQLKLYTQTTS